MHEPQSQRNAEIAKRHADGQPVKWIASFYRVSPVRVRQIVARAKKRERRARRKAMKELQRLGQEFDAA